MLRKSYQENKKPSVCSELKLMSVTSSPRVRVACRSVIRIARNAQLMAVGAEVSIFLHEPHPLLGATAQRFVFDHVRPSQPSRPASPRAYRFLRTSLRIPHVIPIARFHVPAAP